MEKKNPFKTITVCEGYYKPMSRNELIRNLWVVGVIVGFIISAVGFISGAIMTNSIMTPPTYPLWLFDIGLGLMAISFLGFISALKY